MKNMYAKFVVAMAVSFATTSVFASEWMQHSFVAVSDTSEVTPQPGNDNNGNDDPNGPVDPRDDIRTVNTLDEFRKVAVGTEVRLTLQYDTVLCVSQPDIYLRDSYGVFCLTDMKFNLKEGAVLIGSLVGTRDETNGIIQLKASANTREEYVVENEHVFYITPLFVALAWDAMYQSMQEHVGEVYVVDDVTVDSVVSSSGERRLCLRGENSSQQLFVNDRYGVCKGTPSVPFVCQSAKVSVISAGNAVEACPLYALRPEGWSAIDDITTASVKDSAIYDLSGRRLTAEPTRGMYIRNGKKVMVR